jgi:UDP-N-acetylmuramyl pentapeptide phosphotransferase/UDP-N-acetylglucosamine-1-phosphate transferase
MSIILSILISIITIFMLNFFFFKKKILIDKKILIHKSFVSKDLVPLTGGFIIFINLIIFNSEYIIFFFLIFLIGMLSDAFIINSPLKKIFYQFFILFLFVYLSGVTILQTKINLIDFLLNYKLFSILFTTFCLLIVVNGSNFLDGVNTLVCGYYILVISVVLYFCKQNEAILFDLNNFNNIIYSLIVIYFFNFFSKIYLGDSGSFLLGSFVGYYLIILFNNNLNLANYISPYFVVLLLWYPAFENFFSIFRKLIRKERPTAPDNLHFHHLLFNFLKKKNNSIYINTLTGNIINIFNLFTFLVGMNFYYHTQYLIFIIIFNVSFYSVIYFYLYKNFKEK